jgi:hypothetical protein
MEHTPSEEVEVLCWLLGLSVLEKQVTRRKQPGALKTNWPIVSACHADRLGDHRTPVISVVPTSI